MSKESITISIDLAFSLLTDFGGQQPSYVNSTWSQKQLAKKVASNFSPEEIKKMILEQYCYDKTSDFVIDYGTDLLDYFEEILDLEIWKLGEEMGLEKHIDITIESVLGDEEERYHWQNGEIVPHSKKDAKTIISIIESSCGFGPMFYNKLDNRIRFGVYRSFFEGTDKEYEEYCDKFRKGEINV